MNPSKAINPSTKGNIMHTLKKSDNVFTGNNNSSERLENLLKNDFGIFAKITNNGAKLEREVKVSYKGFSLTETFCCSYDNDAVISVIAYRIAQKYPSSSKVATMRKYLEQVCV